MKCYAPVVAPNMLRGGIVPLHPAATHEGTTYALIGGCWWQLVPFGNHWKPAQRVASGSILSILARAHDPEETPDGIPTHEEE